MKRDPAWAGHTATGTVVRALNSSDVDDLNVTVWVEYEVGGATYRHRERVLTRYVPTGRGLGGNGFSEQTVVPCRKGSELVVCYDPADPSRAYLRDNELTPEERARKKDVARRSLRLVLCIVLAFDLLACGVLAYAYTTNGSGIVAAVAGVLAAIAVVIVAVVVLALRTRA